MDRVKTTTLLEMKEKGERIVMVSTYDYITAKMADEAGVDIVLVGDSLANVVLGYQDTLAVTMDEMIHHTRAVDRAVKHALVVGDMPFMSYQAGIDDAIRNSGRFLKEAHARAVKIEGGRGVIDKVKAIVNSGIPVMGHVGLTPQWIHQFGGYGVRGKTGTAARSILEDAKSLEKAGAFSIVLECVPWQLAKIITSKLDVPTIGCGAGSYCDGQVLVLHDLIGFTDADAPKFVKRYADVGGTVRRALGEFRREVKEKKFPTIQHSYEMPEHELKKISPKRRNAK
jgi:3-methyl-2-oxobutanoate hydroxymethyltransferase